MFNPKGDISESETKSEQVNNFEIILNIIFKTITRCCIAYKMCITLCWGCFAEKISRFFFWCVWG